MPALDINSLYLSSIGPYIHIRLVSTSSAKGSAKGFLVDVYCETRLRPYLLQWRTYRDGFHLDSGTSSSLTNLVRRLLPIEIVVERLLVTGRYSLALLHIQPKIGFFSHVNLFFRNDNHGGLQVETLVSDYTQPSLCIGSYNPPLIESDVANEQPEQAGSAGTDRNHKTRTTKPRRSRGFEG